MGIIAEWMAGFQGWNPFWCENRRFAPANVWAGNCMGGSFSGKRPSREPTGSGQASWPEAGDPPLRGNCMHYFPSVRGCPVRAWASDV